MPAITTRVSSRLLLFSLIACLSFLALTVTARSAQAFTHGTLSTQFADSNATGDWSNTMTWVDEFGTPPFQAPNGFSDIVIASTDTVTLDQAATANNLTIRSGATLDLNGKALFVNTQLDLQNGAAIVNSGAAAPVYVYGELAVGSANITGANITVLECEGDPSCENNQQSLHLASGQASTWTSSSLTQVGGTAKFAGHDSPTLNASFQGVAVTVDDASRLGTMVLSGTGTVTVKATAKNASESDPAVLRLASLSATGTHTVTTDWAYLSGSPAVTDRVNLISASTGGLTSLTATSAGVSNYTKTSELLYVTYASELASTGAPTISSSNATSGVAKAGDTLTCGQGSWSAAPASRTWAWKRGSTAITGQNASTYTVQAADIGQNISCSVTATKDAATVSSVFSSTVNVPALPTVDIGTPFKDGVDMGAAMDKEGAWTLAWYVINGSLQGCKINGSPVTCSGERLSFDPATVPNNSTVTFDVIGANTAGATTTKTISFKVALPEKPKKPAPKLTVATPGDETLEPGDMVDLEIQTDTDATVSCKVNDAPVTCTNTSVKFPLSLPLPGREGDTVVVTATNEGGSTTETRLIKPKGSRNEHDLPRPVYAEAGTTVSVQTKLDFQFWADDSVAYRFTGELQGITWKPINSRGWYSDGTIITVKAPSKPGTYTADLRWGPDGFAKMDELVLKVFKADQIKNTVTFDGITDANKPLTCPGKAPFQWYINGVLKFETETPQMPTDQKTSNAAIDCRSTDPATGKPMETKALVVDGTKMTAVATGNTVKIAISKTSQLEISLIRTTFAAAAAKKKSPKPASTFKVKVKKGTNKIVVPKKLRKKFGKKNFQVQVRVIGKKGKKSKPMTLNVG